MNEKILIQKFGGTSVGSTERIKAVAKLCIETREKENCKLVVVVSAMGHTTDELVSLMNEVTAKDKLSCREQDMLLSSGEQVSMALLAMALQAGGTHTISMTGWQAGIKTDSNHTNARISDINTEKILKALNNNKIVVIAGFQGISEQGEITTLGRGGSDTTAVALAVALKAERCDIYTDVRGVYTTDPRIVNDAAKLNFITYDEMLELANLGAQVLHPRSVEIARNFSIPMRVRSSWHTDDYGTLIISREEENNMIEGQRTLRGVVLDRQQARLAIVGVPDEPGIAYKIFCQLADKGISIDLIVQCVSHDGLSEVDFTVSRSDAHKAKKELENIAKEINAKSISMDESVVKVSVVGAGMINQPGIAAKLFKVLGENKINIQIISTSEIHISCIIDESQGENAVRLIHETFALDKVK